MQELTQSPEPTPGLSPDKAGTQTAQIGAETAQIIDSEKDKSPHFQRPKDTLTGLCSIQDDMKGATGQLGGLFGM